MKNHTYYRLVLKLSSPLAVGNGNNELSDHDCIRHNNGKPYIPASSIAGVFRHYFDGKKSLQDQIFGRLGSFDTHSSVIFYDAELSNESVFTIRDSVRLKDKVGQDGAKFDMEVVETGAEFLTFIEIDKENADKQPYIEELILALKNNILRFGAKTTRGYGMVEVSSVKKLEFDLDSTEGTEKWLEFNMFDTSAWKNAGEFKDEKNYSGAKNITLTLRQEGAVSIRVYTTDVKKENEKYAPDYKHMTLRNGKPVIPGTSWAGAFRERYEAFSGEEDAKKLFGFVDTDTKDTQRSRIIFSESVINNCVMKNITRNSIDRFSAKTKDSALYTEKTCYNGITELSIIVPDDMTDKEKKCLTAVILDLHNGFLAVGGLTTVGHGLFSIEKIKVNGQDKTGCLSGNDLLEIWR